MGSGGGLPAIPLAAAFPAVTVHAVDAVEKKIQAVRTMGRRLGLDNLHPWHGRAEAWPGGAVFSVSRATAPLVDLWTWHVRIRRAADRAGEGHWRPGLVCLKGGDLGDEIAALRDAYPLVEVETPQGRIAYGNVEAAVPLPGALDLEAALAACSSFVADAENPYVVHVGSGVPILSNRRTDELAQRVAALGEAQSTEHKDSSSVTYVGVPVGHRWARELMEHAARLTGGLVCDVCSAGEIPALRLLSTE